MKTCFKCQQSLPRSEFYKHARMADGLLGKCKECTRADARKHRAQNIERIREYDRRRAKAPHRRALSSRVAKEYRKTHPKRAKANRKVAYHVRAGHLKQKPCEVCGSETSVAHHDDYSAPLDVMWLCQPHHKARHAELDAAGHDYKDT